jgi:hypothetical protein
MHATHMTQTRNEYEILVGKPKEREFGDSEKGERIMDFKEFVYAVWTGFIWHNMNKRQSLVNTELHFWLP